MGGTLSALTRVAEAFGKIHGRPFRFFFFAYDGPLFTTTTAEEAGKMIPIKSGRHLRLRYSIDTWSKRIHSQLLNMTVVFEAQVVTARDKECWGCKCGT